MSRRWVRPALSIVVAAILAATLVPFRGQEVRPMLWCIVCGQGGWADVVLNIALFLPLGGLLALAGVPRRRAWLAGALLTALIECAQLGIPGRDASIGDVLANTAGTVLGFALAEWLVTQLRRRRRPGLGAALAPAAVVLVIITGAGLLLRPNYPENVDYYGQWTPDLGYLEWYRGRVLAAELDAIPLPSAHLHDAPRLRQLLLAGAPLHVRAVAGPRVTRLAPIFNVYDEARREVVLLGVDARDFVLRYRTGALAHGLNEPDLRLLGAARQISPGDTLDITMWREPGGFCLRLNARRACGLSFTPGRSWALLNYPTSLPEWLRRLVDVGWLAGLLFLVGFLSRGDRGGLLAAGALSLAGLAGLPRLVGLLDTTAPEWLGALAGLLAGAALWRFWARRLSGVPTRSS